MDIMDKLLVITVNYEKTVTLITIQNSFIFKQEKYYFNFCSSQDSFFDFFLLIYIKWLIVRL